MGRCVVVRQNILLYLLLGLVFVVAEELRMHGRRKGALLEERRYILLLLLVLVLVGRQKPDLAFIL